jgi:aldehyde dehydrogenase (NAD+)
MSAAASLPPVPHADVDGIPDLVANLRARFASGLTRPLAWRLEQLKRLEAMLRDNQAALSAALTADLRARDRGLLMDIGGVASEIAAMRKQPSWMKPQRVTTPLAIQPAKSFVVREPLGGAGHRAGTIRSSSRSRRGAPAAGNCRVKLSEMTPHTSGALAS